MSWDPVWESIFSSRPWGRYPQEEVVRFVARAFYRTPDRSEVRILELGCGPGSGASWFVAREGFALSGIDGSPTAIEKSRARFAEEGLAGEFVHGDVTELPWADASFDAVLDVGCLTCNTEQEAARIVAEVHRVLKPAGLHFSLTPKAGCWGDGTGERLDATTRFNVEEGVFKQMGKTRFATEESIRRLYASFTDLSLEYEARSAENRTREVLHWVITCRK
jgi:SAM-dependent methyltransferase